MFQYHALQTGQVTVTGSATLIVAQYSARATVTLCNVGSSTVYIGENSNVTASTGFPLIANAIVTLATTAGIYGISSGGSDTVGWAQTN